jgi:hypothetical protein
MDARKIVNLKKLRLKTSVPPFGLGRSGLTAKPSNLNGMNGTVLIAIGGIATHANRTND